MTVNALKKIISRNSDSVDTDSEIMRALKQPSKTNDVPIGEKEPISRESLNQLIPVRSMSEEELTAFSIGGYAEKFVSSVKLFTEGDVIDSVLYLLSGSVKIESTSGRGYEISAGSAQSRFPLSTGLRHTTTGTTATPVTVLRVSNKVMANSQESVDSEIMGETVELQVIPPELEDSQLFQAIYQNYRQEELALSILPTVADMVTKAIARDINPGQAARIIETDAVITAKILSVANSPLFHGAKTVSTVLDAVNVLGMKATRYIVQNACTKFVLKSENQPYLKRVQKACAESLRISGLCYALATLTERVDPKQALTAGLISNIGVMPFSHYVDKFPTQMYEGDEIDAGWPIVRGFMGSFVLEKLGLPEMISDIPLLSDDWMYESEAALDLADVVIISRYLVNQKETDGERIPAMDSIPAIRKLGGNGLTAELTRLLKQTANKRVKMPLAVVKQPLNK